MTIPSATTQQFSENYKRVVTVLNDSWPKRWLSDSEDTHLWYDAYQTARKFLTELRLDPNIEGLIDTTMVHFIFTDKAEISRTIREMIEMVNIRDAEVGHKLALALAEEMNIPATEQNGSNAFFAGLDRFIKDIVHSRAILFQYQR